MDGALIKMADLKECVEELGHDRVRTYIASGNVLFESGARDQAKLEAELERAIEERFALPVKVVVLSRRELASVVRAIPEAWVSDPDLRVNVAFTLRGADARKIAAGLKPKEGIDEVVATKGALVIATRRDALTRTGVKLVGQPAYKQLTLRNVNTTLKLAELLAD